MLEASVLTIGSSDVPVLLVAIGAVFLVGLVADLVGRRTAIPRVTLLMTAGLVAGPAVLDWIPASVVALFPVLTTVALTMVGFLIGQKLTVDELRAAGRTVLWVSISVVVATAFLVTIALTLAGLPLAAALLLGGISVATAPAAITDVVREHGDDSPAARLLLDIVAIDDLWALLLFSVLLVVAQTLSGDAFDGSIGVAAILHVFGAVSIGLVLGVPIALLSGRITPGEPTQAEALGAIALAAGFSLWIEASSLLAGIVMGATVANLARHHTTTFDSIAGIDWPFLILFFLLAGASLEPASVATAGLALGVYVVGRIGGRIAGVWIGRRVAGPEAASRVGSAWDFGLALLPQAGVAIGLALTASQAMPELKSLVLPVALASTVVFELFGPLLANRALTRANERSVSSGPRSGES